MLRHLVLSLVVLSFATAACDSGPTPSELEAKKKAEEENKAQEDALAKRKADREAKVKAEEDAAAALAAQIDGLATLPAEMPKKLADACAARAQAEDDFMSKHFTGDALAKWNEAKGTQLGFAKQNCEKVGKIEIPACQIEALNNAPEELRKNLPDLLKRCIDKYKDGGEAVAAGGPPAGGAPAGAPQ
jgi:membrane protein involved in colicin uptake